MKILSKCAGTDCDKKLQCERYTVEPLQKWQPWMVMSVSIPDPKVCRFFISNEEKSE